MKKDTKTITSIILQAGEKARRETSNEPEPGMAQQLQWPIQCTVGPGLEGAIASETRIGYVNGAKGWLIYRGYDIFDLCAYSTYEEVAYLLLHGSLPTAPQLQGFKRDLVRYGTLSTTLRLLMGFPVEKMNVMGALRLGTNLMRQEFTGLDRESGRPSTSDAIGSDEDSIPMETVPRGESRAIYEFKKKKERARKGKGDQRVEDACGIDAVYHLIAGVATLTAAIARVHQGRLPIEPDPSLSHAGNFLYMMTGKKPSPVEERIMDVALILHADHGMNASTFASLVVASTLADIYFSVGSGIAALSGPLHGGANEEVVRMLMKIGGPDKVKPWLKKALSTKRKVSGFGHRVYKAYDPRARILGPLATYLAEGNPAVENLCATARVLEQEMARSVAAEKKIFPNVDFYSGIVYSSLGIDPILFTPIFAVARVAGWTARVYEYLQNNRIFRPRAMYVGEFNKKYVPLTKR
jgi:citrate synthase